MNAPGWFERSLIASEVTDICINAHPSGVMAFRDEGLGLAPIVGSDEEPWACEDVHRWVIEQLSAVGKTWDAKHPFIDATLRSGHRAHVIFPPIARHGILLSLRRLAKPGERMHRWRSSPAFPLLRDAVRAKQTVLISGSTGSGKTTLLTDLLEEISPSERIVGLEDTPELAPAHPHFVGLCSRTANADGFGEVTLRSLLRQALRMRPDRIILGECRGSEVLDLLQALNTGHEGTLGTLHANSARDALRRIELLCILAAGAALPVSAIRELVASAVQFVAQVERRGSERLITELWKLEGREGDTILMRPMVQMKPWPSLQT